MILSSGNPEDFNGQDSDSATTDWQLDVGDEDLENAIPGADVLDPCYIQFEFRCPPSSDIFTPEVNFDYVFGSEEYVEYVFSVSYYFWYSFLYTFLLLFGPAPYLTSYSSFLRNTMMDLVSFLMVKILHWCLVVLHP